MNTAFFISLKNTIFLLISNFVGIILPFLARTCMIKYMGEDYLGINNLFTSIFQVINFANFGFTTAISVYLYKPLSNKNVNEVNKILKLLKTINDFLGALVFVVGTFCLLNLRFFLPKETPQGVDLYLLFIIYLADLLFNYLFKSYSSVLLVAMQRSDICNKANIVFRVLFGILQLLSLIYIRRIELYVFLTLCVSVSNRVYTFLYVKNICPQYKPIGKVDSVLRMRMFKDSLALGLQKIGNVLSVSLDNIVIARYLDLTAVSRYGNYSYIIEAIKMIVNSISSGILAVIGTKIAITDNDKFSNFELISTLYLLIGTFCSIIYFSCVHNFIYIWIGEKFISNSCVLLITLTFFIYQTKSILSLYKDASGLWWSDRYRPLVGGIINFTLNIILVSKCGLEGVIFSTFFAITFIEFPWELAVYFNNNLIQLRSFMKNLIRFSITTLLAIFLCDLFLKNLEYNIFNLFLRAVFSTFIALLVVCIFNYKNESFKNLLNYFFRQIRFVKTLYFD